MPGIEGLYVMQGYYKNPGPRQSRSARWGKDHRSEDEALSLVLAWMEMHHSEASSRVTRTAPNAAVLIVIDVGPDAAVHM